LGLASKWQKRAWAITTSALNNLLLPLLGPVVSLLVIRLASAQVWGEFVGVLLVVSLGAHVVGWGNKEYLLREFSRQPARMAEAWQSGLWTRGLLALALSLGLMVWAGWTPRAGWLGLWALALWLEQSYDVLVTYHRAFGFALLVDAGGLALTALSVFFARRALTADGLITLYAGVASLQALAFVFRFRAHVRPAPAMSFPAFRFSFLRAALPFFLLGLSGLLQSRADLYVVNALLPRTDVARYQVFVNFLLYLQAIANVVLLPFVKSLYRLGPDSLPKLSLRLSLFGLAILAPGLFALYVLLSTYYRFHFSLATWVAGGLLVFPIYVYLPRLYALYKANRPARVLLFNLLGGGISLLLSLWLVPGLGLTGAVLAAAAAQWFALLAYLSQTPQFESVSTSPSPDAQRTESSRAGLRGDSAVPPSPDAQRSEASGEGARG
jgi:O-antigen/teichoic acid export membrane protein